MCDSIIQLNQQDILNLFQINKRLIYVLCRQCVTYNTCVSAIASLGLSTLSLGRENLPPAANA